MKRRYVKRRASASVAATARRRHHIVVARSHDRLVHAGRFDDRAIAAHRVRGDEVAGHGRTNTERQSTLDETAERADRRSDRRFDTGREGRAARGWLSLWIAESPRAPDLLAAAGYAYTLNWCKDDQPVWMRTASAPLASIPHQQEVNDIHSIIAR